MENVVQELLLWTTTQGLVWTMDTPALAFLDMVAVAAAAAAAVLLWWQAPCHTPACTTQLLHSPCHCSMYHHLFSIIIPHISIIRVVVVVQEWQAHPSIITMTSSNITWTIQAVSTLLPQYHPQKWSAHHLQQENSKGTGHQLSCLLTHLGKQLLEHHHTLLP